MKVLALGLVALALAAAPMKLTLQQIVQEPGLTGPAPENLTWSPDGRTLAYILADSTDPERRNLWGVDARTGEQRILVSADQLERLAPTVDDATADERERERRKRYSVASYLWSKDSQFILFASSGSLFLYDLAAERAREVTPGLTDVRAPQFSPDGSWISFVYQHDLWLAPTDGGDARQLTRGGTEDLLHGELDWIYAEEFGLRSGYEWSPNSRHIAFYEIDQSGVPQYPIPSLTEWKPSLSQQRYPQSGDPNPKVRIGVVEARPSRGDEVVWIDAGDPEYIPRIAWVNEQQVALQTLNRAQTQLEIRLADAEFGRSETIVELTDRYWVNVTDDLRFLEDGGFVWTTERSGLRHIERRNANGKPVKTVTSGEFEVQSIVDIDEAGGWIYYLSNEANVLGVDLYRVDFNGEKKQRLTDGAGTHSAKLSPTHDAWTDSFSSLADPGGLDLVRLDADSRFEIHRDNDLDDYELIEPDLRTIETEDGATIRLLLLQPADREPGKKYPLVLYVYGGPHAPTIRDTFDAGRARGLFHQYLAQNGFVVAQVDDRASSIRGHKYEALLSRDYGPTALRDQLTALEELKKLPYVDGERVAIWGWSGGGFATCFALTHSDAFRAGAAVASVTDWRLYDSIYTERYMGRPQDEPEAYRRTSCVEAAGDLSGRLLLVHGTADDNVHVQNTIKMADALIEKGKQFDLQLYPGKTHGIAGEEARLHLYSMLEEFFARWLAE